MNAKSSDGLPPQDTLQRLFIYRNGKLYWRIDPSLGCKAGAQAGWIEPTGYRRVRGEMQGQLDRLHGLRFSERNFNALTSRANTAERRVLELEARLSGYEKPPVQPATAEHVGVPEEAADAADLRRAGALLCLYAEEPELLAASLEALAKRMEGK